MAMSDRSRRRLWDAGLPLLLSICFIASSLLFLVHMIMKNQQENVEYLLDSSNQKKISILKQIEGDIQTLEGLAIVLGEMEAVDKENLMPLLEDVNDQNAFIRMGFAGPDGEAWLVDVNGAVYQRNIKDMEFFREALKGNNNVSDIVPDDQKENHYINYYGVTMRNASGEVKGVLCAVHSADVLRSTIDAPVLNGQGFSDIVDANGTYILRSINDLAADLLPEDQVPIGDAAGKENGVPFTVIDRTGRKQMAVLIPLLEERWFLLSMVPQHVLRARYIETAMGIMAIIAVACCLFALFLARQRILVTRNQKMLMNLAYWDSLTGLRNYDGFKMEVKSLLPGENLSSFVVWYGDLKKFKFINDILGYAEGDKILMDIAGYLRQFENKESIICRISADNFAGITRCEGEEWLIGVFREVQKYLKNSERQIFLDLSVGFYRLCPGDETLSVDVLVNYANMARRVAKERPGSSYAFYDSQLKSREIEESMMEAEAEKALAAGEFQVYMQPKVDIQNENRLSGAEALVRWISPFKGMIPPNRFIPLFEKSDRIIMLDRYMFQQTCKWYQGYLEDGGRPLSIAVNVSKVGLLQKDFVEYYSRVKESCQIPDGLLELEFTEGVLLNDTEMFYNLVRELQTHGFTCSLDDFGSGYSSLNLLKDLPIDVLKLDILFFRKSRDMERERIVVSSFIHMAKELRIKTIAEGVETIDSVEFLRDSGCDVIQGYVFAKPMPLEEFNRLAREQGEEPLTAHNA